MAEEGAQIETEAGDVPAVDEVEGHSLKIGDVEAHRLEVEEEDEDDTGERDAEERPAGE